MEDKKIVWHINLDIIEYLMLVDAIVAGYFDDYGDYKPHIGALNCMRLFYNLCVTESKFDDEIPHDFTDILLVGKLAADRGFVDAFQEATTYRNEYAGRLNFSEAYQNAIDIIDNKSNPLEKLYQGIMGMLKSVAGELTDENIKAIGEFATQVKNGNVDYYKLMEGYGNSDSFKNTVAPSEGKEQGNIVDLAEARK